ncbi:MAG: AGE family epimerase/isomerase [Flavobacteriaceae bacterium]|nr:MAG: AGE family epimerase/isomerase [Flavobacteriaceae bacterium]
MTQVLFLKVLYRSIFSLLVFSSFLCNEKQGAKNSKELKFLPEIRASLDDLVSLWYPASIDTRHGGFYPDFNYKWQKEGEQNKMLVTQARHIWTASKLATFYGDRSYENIAAHGFQFLRDKMWDSQYGGFHTLLAYDAGSLTPVAKTKSAYGNGFAIYGLAAYFEISKDSSALDLAKKTFYWLEEHAHDSEFKGYFDVLNLDGSWMFNVIENDRGYDNFIRKDWKDQNSSIHLLEAFTALYEVWPNRLLKERLEELLILIRDTITTQKGFLTLHLERDWTPVSFKDSTESFRLENFWLDHVSFGHDVETGFLLLEASEVLYHTKDSTTLTIAKRMIDHGIDHGWDFEKGGFFDGGYYLEESDVCTILNPAKIWWSQAEGLNSLLLMSQLYPDKKVYFELFEQQWNYINEYLIDHTYGGWYDEGLDSDPEAAQRAKAHVWKVNYHNIRSLINVIQMLEGRFKLTNSEL